MNQPTKAPKDLVVRVHQVKDFCPVYKEGDSLYAKVTSEGAWVFDLERSSVKTLCISAMPSLIGEMMKVRHGIQNAIYVHCLDPGPPYTKSSAVFEIRAAEMP